MNIIMCGSFEYSELISQYKTILWCVGEANDDGDGGSCGSSSGSYCNSGGDGGGSSGSGGGEGQWQKRIFGTKILSKSQFTFRVFPHLM